MYSLVDIIEFVKDKTGVEEVTAEADIENDLGCYGDDWDELIQEYASRYQVDMSSYLWYFHTDEEGHSNSIGRAFFKAPYERVTRIPVTPQMFLDFANKGKWDIPYPPHTLPKRRYDILINQILVVFFIAYAIYSCSK
ncbi:DUF1493 family protein [Rufibacter roseolus]|uniref:DUF1493 family protein n=1 Tax=Rufibacter roseolus TaxID=2817375 RepID=UPI001B312F8C|nr:DUF1493 family protein [Rufibacter roseolus]